MEKKVSFRTSAHNNLKLHLEILFRSVRTFRYCDLAQLVYEVIMQ